MNVVIAYLETMFSSYPQTPRLLEAKAELQTMMEDAYSSLIAEGSTQNEAVGKVITDFGNLDEVAPALGITAEIAPADATSMNLASGAAAPALAAGAWVATQPPVTMKEAEGFAGAHRNTRYRLGAGVALCVMSPIPLLLLLNAAAMHDSPVDSGAAVVAGTVLLLFVAAGGVVLLAGISKNFTPFARLRGGHFGPNPSVTEWAAELAQTHERRRFTALTLAVLLWALSPVPPLIVTYLPETANQGSWIIGSTALTLLLVAAGLLVALPATWARSVANTINRADLRDR
ncbi:hypothetical protein E3T23_05250 [Cryobacterium cheniae]|uniref:Uncharacterized protein n=1 Tax=Cryobacterium cheniae TaxID=1259262 RepID=A0A4R8XUK0_9MICO|nr:permease prefix domain 1-containing protein [Cryobacterium cheniae]TFC82084.1 hypothetical protein E3T23_05250 [Cryobacterium cheniae]